MGSRPGHKGDPPCVEAPLVPARACSFVWLPQVLELRRQAEMPFETCLQHECTKTQAAAVAHYTNQWQRNRRTGRKVQLVLMTKQQREDTETRSAGWSNM